MTLSQHFIRPRPIPLIMTAVAVITLFGLGAWQVQRLFWKEAIIAQLEAAEATAPLLALPEDIDAHRFYRVQIEGTFLPDTEFHLAARYYQSKLGYSVLTPFQLHGGGPIVLVSRGWIPAAQKNAAPPPPLGTTTILAQIRTSNERNPFTPENQPNKNIWFGRDALAMGAFAGLEVLPFTLDLIGEQDVNHLPVPSDGKLRPRNDHLHYAITWFAIGIAALTVSLLYHRKPRAQVKDTA